MRAAGDAGYPVPRRLTASGHEIAMERVGGPTMLHEIASRPSRLRHCAAVLADLHERLDAPDGLGRPVGVAGNKLLHLDLQSENILIDPERGPVVLDWEWAAAGPPAADIAHTWLQLATSEIPGSRWRRVVGAAGGRAFLRAFLARVDQGAAEEQMAAGRQYRLAERELTARERRAVTDFRT
jgi:aminoglycoside phosphotransferase (APT) family kinase protein